MVLIVWELISHFLGIAKTSVLFSTVVRSDYFIACQSFHQKAVVLVKQLVDDGDERLKGSCGPLGFLLFMFTFCYPLVEG